MEKSDDLLNNLVLYKNGNRLKLSLGLGRKMKFKTSLKYVLAICLPSNALYWPFSWRASVSRGDFWAKGGPLSLLSLDSPYKILLPFTFSLCALVLVYYFENRSRRRIFFSGISMISYYLSYYVAELFWVFWAFGRSFELMFVFVYGAIFITLYGLPLFALGCMFSAIVEKLKRRHE